MRMDGISEKPFVRFLMILSILAARLETGANLTSGGNRANRRWKESRKSSGRLKISRPFFFIQNLLSRLVLLFDFRSLLPPNHLQHGEEFFSQHTNGDDSNDSKDTPPHKPW